MIVSTLLIFLGFSFPLVASDSSTIVDSSQGLTAQKIANVDVMDTTRGLIVHNNYLWMTSAARKSEVKVFDLKGNLTKVIETTHRPADLFPVNADTVITFGYNWIQNQNQFTLIKMKSGSAEDSIHLTKTTHSVGVNTTLSGSFTSNGKDLFFSLATEGGDRRRVGKTYLGQSKINPIPLKLDRPSKLILIGDFLYAIEKSDFEDKVIRYFLPKDRSEVVLTEKSYDVMSDMLFLKKPGVLSVASIDKVYLFGITDSRPTVTLDLSDTVGDSLSLGEYGKCVVVASQTMRELRFFDLKTKSLVDTWDLAFLGRSFKHLTKVVVDPDSLTVFVRSVYPTPFLSEEEESSVWMITRDTPIQGCL